MAPCESECTTPNFSPDGKYIAYLMEGEVWVSETARPAATRQQVSVSGGSTPRWSHDGREILYVDNQEMIAVAVEVSARGLRVVRRQTLFSTAGRNYFRRGIPIVHPLCHGFLYVKVVDTEGPQAVVVLNFIEELKARLPPD